MSSVCIMDEDYMWVVDIGSAEKAVSLLHNENCYLKEQESAGNGNHDDSTIDALSFLQNQGLTTEQESILLEQWLEAELGFEFSEITPNV